MLKNEEGGKGSSLGESQSLHGKLVHPKKFCKPDLKEVQMQSTQALAWRRQGRLRNMQHGKGKVYFSTWNCGLYRSYI